MCLLSGVRRERAKRMGYLQRLKLVIVLFQLAQFCTVRIQMKTAYFLVFLLALTFVPEHVDGWFFRSVRRIRISPYHTLGCMAACKWARSWACKACKRKRGLDVPDADVDENVTKVMQYLDLNGDGFIEPVEITHMTGVDMSNPVRLAKFRKADTNGDGKLDLSELVTFHFENKTAFLDAIAKYGR